MQCLTVITFLHWPGKQIDLEGVKDVLLREWDKIVTQMSFLPVMLDYVPVITQPYTVGLKTPY